MSIEIEKAKLDIDTNFQENDNESSNSNSNNEPDDILLSIQKARTQKYIEKEKNEQSNNTIKNTHIPKTTTTDNKQSKTLQNNNNNNQQKPTQNNDINNTINEIKKTPIWKKLSELVKDKTKNDNIIAQNIVLSMVNYPLNYYLIIYYFVYFSDDLTNRISLKIILVRAMIEVLNNYIKLYKNRQQIWNNKNVVIAISLMQSWKLNEFLDKLIKENK